MKKLIIIILAATLSSCVQTSIEVVDGCEYIKTTSITSHGNVESLTHKGNCRNPIHLPPVKDTLKLPLIQGDLK